MASQGIGSFLTGALKGLSDYTYSERDAQRKREDETLKSQQAYLDHILAGVQAGTIRPEIYAQALQDAHAAGEALSSPRKPKKGAAGFFGETDGPALPFLQAMREGTVANPNFDPSAVDPRTAAAMAAPPSKDITVGGAMGPGADPSQFTGPAMEPAGGSGEVAPQNLPSATDLQPPPAPDHAAEFATFVKGLTQQPAPTVTDAQIKAYASSQKPTWTAGDIFTPNAPAEERLTFDAKLKQDTQDAETKKKLAEIDASSASPEVKAAAKEMLITGIKPMRPLPAVIVADSNSPTGFSSVTKDAIDGHEITRTMGVKNPNPTTRMQYVEVTQGGKTRMVNFNPATGEFFDPGSKTPLEGAIKKPAKPSLSAVGAMSGPASQDVKDIAGAIRDGKQAPDLKGLYRMGGPVRAELARNGYDLVDAQEDWQAVQAYLRSANSTPQLRLRQNVETTKHSLDIIDALATQWQGGGFPLLNKANLMLATNGANGPQAASIANKLLSQIADVTTELGSVYAGGNSTTDHMLELASKNLSADWDETVLHDMISQTRQNLQIRENSIKNVRSAGRNGENAYDKTVVPDDVKAALKGAKVGHGVEFNGKYWVLQADGSIK